MSFVLDRHVLQISGADAARFLGDLISNTLPEKGAITYAALLSPQGKYLFDFFVLRADDGFYIDVAADQAAALKMRLTMYKLRAAVDIADTDLRVSVGQGEPPAGALFDPRHPMLGWRAYGADAQAGDLDWNALYIDQLIPRTGVELIPDQTYILEAGFERLNGVDFKKGCYVGQEVTARMKHKTELNKGLIGVSVAGEVPVDTAIMRADKKIGTVYSNANGLGIAHLRFAQMGDGMSANGLAVSLREDAS
ncbi:MAG: folate-binding protein [Pseudomonadota bacterium]